jgi:two-component system, chemotaxis family, chemotaxis protein CheY
LNAHSSPSPSSGLRVLVVDDDSDVRETFAEVLTDMGCAVDTAVHGVDALSRLRNRQRPNVILLDLTMPVMDGVTFLRMQRADPRLSQIPVVVVTASAMDSLPPEVRGMKVLQKPLRFVTLLECVKELEQS